MKYWTQLNKLEEAVYKVRAINSGLQILDRTDEMTSADSGLPEDFQIFLANLTDQMDEAVKNLREKFQDVWDVVREDSFNEDMAAIDDLDKDQADKIRFQKIVDGIKPMNFTTTESTSNWSIEPLQNGDFAVRNDNMASQPTQKDTIVIQEIDGNLTTSYRPTTQQDLFDDQWNETYKRQSNDQ